MTYELRRISRFTEPRADVIGECLWGGGGLGHAKRTRALCDATPNSGVITEASHDRLEAVGYPLGGS